MGATGPLAALAGFDLMTVARLRITRPPQRGPDALRVHPGRDWFTVLSGTVELVLVHFSRPATVLATTGGSPAPASPAPADRR